jgi:mRNA interferase MazF
MEISEYYAIRDKKDQGKPYVSMGDIYYAQLGTNIGSEIDKERPVLVFQGEDRFIRLSNTAVVIPITSNVAIKPYRVVIKADDIIDNHGLDGGSVLVQQIRSISKARLALFKGKLSEEKIKEVSHEVINFFYKGKPLLQEEGDAQTVLADAAKTVIIGDSKS